MGFIGRSLEPEFGSPRLEKPDADDLIATMEYVKKLLAESSLEPGLRLNLERHVDAILWWLAHPEMASVQNIFETIGSAFVIARQIQDCDPTRNSPEPSASKNIVTKIVEATYKLGRILGVVTRTAEVVDELGGQANHFLERFNAAG